MGQHIVLLGDSIFDNGAYVGGGPAVIDQLRVLLPRGGSATLRAVDGHTTAGVYHQLGRLPAGATHLVVSAGGNDALGALGVLSEGTATVGSALARIGQVGEAFERAYRAMLAAVVAAGLPTVVCTVYRPRFDEPELQSAAVAGLSVFNDAILRTAFEHGLPVIDLRLIATEYEDYANEIEPSSRGGEKIARAIVAAIGRHDFSTCRPTIYLTG